MFLVKTRRCLLGDFRIKLHPEYKQNNCQFIHVLLGYRKSNSEAFTSNSGVDKIICQWHFLILFPFLQDTISPIIFRAYGSNCGLHSCKNHLFFWWDLSEANLEDASDQQYVLLPCPVSWVPEVRPSSGEGVPEKRSPGTAIPAGWQTQFTGGNASEPPARHNRP